ncbi:hypothetical protein HOH87_04550 [bacterium]|jgi:hypothetical protein|nr:hypothetical protein [bacterium]
MGARVSILLAIVLLLGGCQADLAEFDLSPGDQVAIIQVGVRLQSDKGMAPESLPALHRYTESVVGLLNENTPYGFLNRETITDKPVYWQLPESNNASGVMLLPGYRLFSLDHQVDSLILTDGLGVDVLGVMEFVFIEAPYTESPIAWITGDPLLLKVKLEGELLLVSHEGMRRSLKWESSFVRTETLFDPNSKQMLKLSGDTDSPYLEALKSMSDKMLETISK